MANAPYDTGWLKWVGVEIKGEIRDIQIAEPLLDEEAQSYSLETLSKKYLGVSKNEDMLNEALAAYGQKSKDGLHVLPSEYVGPYGEDDAFLTLQIFKKQRPLLQKEQLWDLFLLENKLVPIIVDMYQKGIRIDQKQAGILNEECKKHENILRNRIGKKRNIWATADIAELFREHKIPIPKTDKGNDSITADYLKSISDKFPVAGDVHELRELNRLREVFIDKLLLQLPVNGRIHPLHIQIAREDGGTRTGRFSCKSPNIQQVPKRSKLGKTLRKCFIPSDGLTWASLDYNSQEVRILVHYAVLLNLPKSKEAKEALESGVKLYTFIEKEAGIDYATAKSMTLGRMYGMGVGTMSRQINKSKEECYDLLQRLDEMCPFISRLSKSASQSAQKKGFVKTLLGRKRHFDFWTPPNAPRGTIPVKGKKQASERFPNERLQRAYTNKALNAIIQGTAADQTKLAMLEAYKQGFTPLMSVHDEINFEVKNEDEAKTLKKIMEDALPMRVQTIADLSLNHYWG